LDYLATPVVYVVLRPSLEDCLTRCRERQRDPRHAAALKDEKAIRQLYGSYSDLDGFERHVIDTSGLTTEATASLVISELESPRFTLA
jgi:hypothetical protein